MFKGLLIFLVLGLSLNGAFAAGGPGMGELAAALSDSKVAKELMDFARHDPRFKKFVGRAEGEEISADVAERLLRDKIKGDNLADRQRAVEILGESNIHLAAEAAKRGTDFKPTKLSPAEEAALGSGKIDFDAPAGKAKAAFSDREVAISLVKEAMAPRVQKGEITAQEAADVEATAAKFPRRFGKGWKNCDLPTEAFETLVVAEGATKDIADAFAAKTVMEEKISERTAVSKEEAKTRLCLLARPVAKGGKCELIGVEEAELCDRGI
jgi:hypothetical protein